MSHHFVTVCVVCVLCAAHIPCSAHTVFQITDATTTTTTTTLSSHDIINYDNITTNSTSQSSISESRSKQLLQLKDYFKIRHNNTSDRKKDNVKRSINTQEMNGMNKTMSIIDNKSYSEKKVLIKRKIVKSNNNNNNEEEEEEEMHKSDDDDDVVVNVLSNNHLEIMERLGQIQPIRQKHGSSSSMYLNNDDHSKDSSSRIRKKRNTDVIGKNHMKKIFEAYGDGHDIKMEGFEMMLKKLGLLTLLIDSTKLDDDHNVDINQSDNQLDSKALRHNNGLQDKSGINKERCLNSKELLNMVAQGIPYNSKNNDTTIPSWLFERVCPVLLYQLLGESSSERTGCIRVPQSYKTVMDDTDYHSEDLNRNMFQVWLYSTISILVISLCGLLGVAVIPVMGKVYYHQLLQFLVALAVGTLCGDALIHLLPHAMMSPMSHNHEHGHDNENNLVLNHEEQHNLNMWKGFTAMIGLVLFFFTEKALTVLAEWRKHRQRRNKLPSRVRVKRESDGPNSNAVGEKLCKHKYSSYPYCYGEITAETQDNHHNRQNKEDKPPAIEEEKPLTENCNSVSKMMTTDAEKKTTDDWRLDDSIVNNAKKNAADGADIPLNESESYTVIIREHETKHHGHTHSHGHVHSAPESMSSVAWMVVMGDGLHNFTDGMAIGAAFAANIAGGFSTAIAVFCHELPHELGDFAVLLKAGMSAKQAVFYNLLSSVLCLFGMILGVLLGSTPAATSWIFSIAAGMFIYIALVDMIPELSSSHSAERSSHWQCLLQALGLSLGLGIMLVIALYEHNLKNIFNN
ncbi:PREDICTED: zinc transporter foi-like [Polistes dominula]|uniref:Zinc transporter foi-like n=1 Tax=Polistes dominula TaxID=743375 RepID=A0ABM1ISN3_POLDO|nr:PREDICTED: zinc transporter foi-like [Polistes dominula]XP_015183220.1 PREDICTED: zinc transporter foi-like [Polistes dominula]XP_015183221.1 PREDICTED: zinc transporter foi-like [Polistes dominula]XP_015183222.1 PREDICTED: zinc transporter foi-like [Polistes dominula]XP_015183223.1 PREDICTED: zinc transporter foi-like [Polistes dominula]XP_015183224.1 PREDICTED: zinc transporter foi-like [Polistes dominula]